MDQGFKHQSVLLPEVIAALEIQADGIYVDATLGRGGHAKAILERLGPQGRLIAIDKDPVAIHLMQETLGQDVRVTLVHASFADLQQVAEEHKFAGHVKGILLDLGVSSPQLDDAQRGFSFLKDGPLDMRMDNSRGKTAAQWLEFAKEADIAKVLFEYGEERYGRRIAKAIVTERSVTPITTTGQLAAIVSAANPAWEKGKHPATRAFQAFRIFINQELNELQETLAQALEVLAVSGRLAVISFHSLEDRITKRFIRRHSRDESLPANLPVMYREVRPRLRALGRGIKPSADEVAVNPRSRSAVLRVAEKLL